MQRRERITLQKILSIIDETAEISKYISKEEFLKSDLFKTSISMEILRIGELVKNLTQEFRKENPQVTWRAISGFRDVIAHKYDVTDMTEVYNTVKKDFPELKNQIEKILDGE